MNLRKAMIFILTSLCLSFSHADNGTKQERVAYFFKQDGLVIDLPKEQANCVDKGLAESKSREDVFKQCRVKAEKKSKTIERVAYFSDGEGVFADLPKTKLDCASDLMQNTKMNEIEIRKKCKISATEVKAGHLCETISDSNVVCDGKRYNRVFGSESPAPSKRQNNGDGVR